MKSVFSLMLLVGLILAGVAVYIVQNYVGAYQNAYREAVMENQKARPEIETTQVYVANRDIRYGEELADEDFRLIAWSKDAIPEGVFDENNPIQKEGDDRRIALRAMNTNEVILASKITEPGAPAGLISELEEGMHGYAMSVDSLMAVGGFNKRFVIKNNLALARAAQGNYSLPIVPMTQTERAELLHTMGLSAAKRGDIAMAKTLFRDAVSTHPQYFEAANRSLDALENS